jgi:hypothetical protein
MQKPFYQSKIVWLGVFVTLQGVMPIVIDLLGRATVDPADLAVAFSGVLTVILRVWFTDAPISK